MATLPLILIAPLLCWVAYCDLSRMQIPNAISLIAVAVFACIAALAPPDDLLPRIAVAAAVLTVGFVSYCFGLFGGGDVKMLAALVLFVPVPTLTLFAFVFSASMLIGMAAVLTVRRIPAARRLGWKSLTADAGFPMGVSIALAGLVHPVATLLLAV